MFDCLPILDDGFPQKLPGTKSRGSDHPMHLGSQVLICWSEGIPWGDLGVQEYPQDKTSEIERELLHF